MSIFLLPHQLIINMSYSDMSYDSDVTMVDIYDNDFSSLYCEPSESGETARDAESFNWFDWVGLTNWVDWTNLANWFSRLRLHWFNDTAAPAQPVPAQLVSAQLVSAQPDPAQLVSAQPVSDQLVSAQPVSAQPVSAQTVPSYPCPETAAHFILLNLTRIFPPEPFDAYKFIDAPYAAMPYRGLHEPLFHNTSKAFRLPSPADIPGPVPVKYLNLASRRLHYIQKHVRSHKCGVWAKLYLEVDAEADSLCREIARLASTIYTFDNNADHELEINDLIGESRRAERIMARMEQLQKELGRCGRSLDFLAHEIESLMLRNCLARIMVWRKGRIVFVKPGRKKGRYAALVEFTREVRWNLVWIKKEAERLYQDRVWVEGDLDLTDPKDYWW